MRVSLFTDTLGDVNGVSRFIQNIAAESLRTGHELEVMTSTRFHTPALRNIHNFKPIAAASMPGYRTLEVCLPPALAMLRHARHARPDAIHVSTPGPVGLVGVIASKRMRVPLLGVYHTDFPAYVEHLLDDAALTWACRRYERWFYSGFRAIFTRSREYAARLGRSGLSAERMYTLAAGIDLRSFGPHFRDTGVWRGLGCDEDRVRVLYVGRISVEKGMDFLVETWRSASATLHASGVSAELVIVGDGPYRADMERATRDDPVRFLGFRHGAELARIYASSDLFVFPSTTDTLGQVVMEAQASGLPVLVTDQGGPKEVVLEGLTGRVLPARDRERWAHELVGLARDAELRRSMGRRAGEHVGAMSIGRSFEQFWSVHAEVVAAHANGR